MFDNTLLDSSSARTPVLQPAHWLISLLAGFSGFVAGSLTLPVEATPSGTKILLLRAAVLGGALMFYVLSVCFAYADARRQGFKAHLWLLVVLAFNLFGFLVYLVYSALKTGDWKRATLPMAYAFEVILVGMAALIPLIYTQALPHSFHGIISIPPSPAGGRPPVSRQVHAQRPSVAQTSFQAPRIIPQTIAETTPATEVVPDFPGVVGAVSSQIPGVPNGVAWAILSSNSVPPPPLSVEKPKPIRRIVLGGQVVAARAIYTPKPEYPSLARLARVQGTVKMEAVIAKDGTVQELKVLSGHPLLINAARETVAQWRYQPTLLNGEPVEVATEIDVNFVLEN